MSKAILQEVAALQAKIDGLQRELDALKRRLDSTPPRTRTQSFGATDGQEATPSDQPPVVARSGPPRTMTRTDAPLLDGQSSRPMPPPPPVPRSEVPPRAKRSIPPPSSPPTPSPSIPASSQVVPVARRATGGDVDLGETPPSTRVTPSRRNALNNPDAGRYEFVGEGKSRRR